MAQQSGKYSVEVRDQFGRLVAVIVRPMNKQFNLYRNKAGSCQFTMDLYDPQATPEILAINKYDIVFRRLGTPVFAGQISYVRPHIDGDRKQVDVIATGYFDLFDQRYINTDFPSYDASNQQLAFSSQDIGTIIGTLIDDTQFPLANDGSVQMPNTTPTLNQSFVAPGTGNLETIKLLLKNVSATGNIIVGIYTDVGGSIGTLVPNSQVTVSTTGISSSLAWKTITYSSSFPSLVEGNVYWIKVYADAPQSGANGVYWYYLNGDYYPSGKAYSPENPSLFSSDQDLQFFIQMADNSFQMTKNSYLGIDQGAVATSFNLSPTFSLYKKIKTCIEDLFNTHNGPDFSISVSIDPVTNIMTKAYNVFYPRQGIDNTALNFRYPGNVKKIDKPKDGKAMINEVAQRGQGSGVDQAVSVAADASSIATYGLRQDVEDQADVADTSTLLSLAQENIRVQKDPLDLPGIVLDGNQDPPLGSYGVGDSIVFHVSGLSMLDFNDTVYRIEEIGATVTDDDQEEIELTCSIV